MSLRHDGEIEKISSMLEGHNFFLIGDVWSKKIFLDTFIVLGYRKTIHSSNHEIYNTSNNRLLPIRVYKYKKFGRLK